MSEIKDGGPAFPCTDAKGFVSEGMSLRDYFAAQALAGLMTDAMRNDRSFSLNARDCYALADAMLAEREKERKA